jgi:hypothetical protein
MLEALLRGKLTRNEEDLEDLLTSNIFGSVKYVSKEFGLIPILSHAEREDGSTPFKQIAQVSDVKYEFWPLLKEKECYPCEPDILLKIYFENGEKLFIIIEAKYKSGKSSWADQSEKPYDQLAREWDNLVSLAKRKKAKPYILYVTAHTKFPNQDVESAAAEYIKKRSAKEQIEIAWISWRKLPKIFDNSPFEIIRDAVEILRRLGLTFFEGFPTIFPKEIGWTFAFPGRDKILDLNWIFTIDKIYWRYDKLSRFFWDWRSPTHLIINWRFNK